jgi:hypothetical protein
MEGAGSLDPPLPKELHAVTIDAARIAGPAAARMLVTDLTGIEA